MRGRPPTRNQEGNGASGDARLFAARAWAKDTLGNDAFELSPLVQDASFRRYFRLSTSSATMVLMDAPPRFEDSAPFLDIAGRLQQGGLHAPVIFAFDLEQGFGLLEDLGDVLYRELLNAQNADEFFPELFRVLARMAQHVDCRGLPVYDAGRLQAELDLFTDWYLQRHKHRKLNDREKRTWKSLCKELISSAREQPSVFVHRDFHCSNLLYLQDQSPGIIDFQDAVEGPLSYDFVSLLWDRYIAWPRRQLEVWMETFRSLVAPEVDPAAWIRWCDLMGLQRNLKIVGIFSRLHYRDEKPGYLQMIPRFYQYVLDVLPRYPGFRDFLDLLDRPECAP